MRVWDESPTGLSSPGGEIMVAVGAIPTYPRGGESRSDAYWVIT